MDFVGITTIITIFHLEAEKNPTSDHLSKETVGVCKYHSVNSLCYISIGLTNVIPALCIHACVGFSVYMRVLVRV